MRPITVQVGPLLAVVGNSAVASQTTTAKGWLALNGTTGTATANNIALSQTPASATTVTINGAAAQTLVQTGTTGALLSPPQRIYVTSAGNNSGITFAVVGLDINGAKVTETMAGKNAGLSVSSNLYTSIISITTSGASTGALTVGSFDSVTFDQPRRVTVTTSAAISFTISGTNWAGDAISETVTNSSSSVTTVQSFKTISSISNSATSGGAGITVGTSAVADSPWVRFDEWGFGPVSIQCDVAGTVNYTVFFSNDDPNSPTNAVDPSAMNWSSNVSPLIGATTTGQGVLAVPFLWGKVTLNSETAGTGNYVSATFTQYSAATY